jgi:hypothetical protein
LYYVFRIPRFAIAILSGARAMSIPQEPSAPYLAPEVGGKRRGGRKRGGKNKPGHKAGRPRKPAEKFHPSIWESGRAEIPVLEKHLATARRANSSHCAIAMAIADAVPHARRIAVDLQTIRWTDPKKGVRYCFLTPHAAQQDVIIPFDQGEECKPVTFRMKPAFVTRIGAKRNHTPGAEQLKGTGLKVAEEQPHVPAGGNITAPEQALAENWKPESPGRGGALVAPIEKDDALREKRGTYKRRPRAMISATKPDGTIPTTLGGKLPPVSVLSRREYGMRVLRK